MFEISPEDLKIIYQSYVVPWSIKIAFALVIFLVGRIIARFVSRMVGKILAHSSLDKILIDFVKSIVQAIILIFVVVAALDQVGVNTSSMIALVGAAGLAIGLALQGSLQNFAAGFLLLIFRPFRAGDFVEAAGTSGNIERIGIFSTILVTGDNKEVIIPNGAIYSSNIINYSKRDKRRIDLSIGIGYDDNIGHARDIVKSILEADTRILKVPEAVIAVGELGPSSVNIFIRPWVETADFWPVRFSLLEAIKVAFDQHGITIPYPQMALHVAGRAPDAPDAPSASK